jgi:hypothetical protein
MFETFGKPKPNRKSTGYRLKIHEKELVSQKSKPDLLDETKETGG